VSPGTNSSASSSSLLMPPSSCGLLRTYTYTYIFKLCIFIAETRKYLYFLLTYRFCHQNDVSSKYGEVRTWWRKTSSAMHSTSPVPAPVRALPKMSAPTAHRPVVQVIDGDIEEKGPQHTSLCNGRSRSSILDCQK